jgi:hypothetical protein
MTDPGADPVTGPVAGAWPPPYGYGPPPKHPKADTSLGLGLFAVVGAIFFCGLPLLVAPFAWGLGQRTLREIRASGGAWSGERDARAGMVLGIVGTVLLVAGLVLLGWLLTQLPGGLDTELGESPAPGGVEL